MISALFQKIVNKAIWFNLYNQVEVSGVSRGRLGGAQPPLPTLGPPLEKFETAVGEDVCPPYRGPERGRALPSKFFWLRH
jgi:hypothetical protein